MGKFTPEEIAYVQSQRFGRLATVSQDGELHVVPVTFRYHPEDESIAIGGENLTQTKKYRDAVRHGRVAFVVDDVLPPMHTASSSALVVWYAAATILRPHPQSGNHHTQKW